MYRFADAEYSNRRILRGDRSAHPGFANTVESDHVCLDCPAVTRTDFGHIYGFTIRYFNPNRLLNQVLCQFPQRIMDGIAKAGHTLHRVWTDDCRNLVAIPTQVT